MANEYQPRTVIGFNPSRWDKLKSFATPRWSDTGAAFQNAGDFAKSTWGSLKAMGNPFASPRLATTQEFMENLGATESPATGIVKSRVRGAAPVADYHATESDLLGKMAGLVPSAAPVDMTSAAARAKGISDNAITGLSSQAGRMNITAGGTNYKNVSPAFAKTAGLKNIPEEAETAITEANQKAGAAAQEGINADWASRNTAYTNALIKSRSQPAQAQPIGMTRNEMMTRYGTSFPDVRPMNPTWRDVANARDFKTRSMLVPTSNPGVGAGSSASSGVDAGSAFSM